MSFADLQRIFFKGSKAARITSFWSNLFTKNPEMKNVFVTLDIAFGDGIVHRVSTDFIEVIDENGNPILYRPALEEEISIDTKYTKGTAEAAVRNYSLTLDSRTIKPLDMINNGISLAGIAEISLQQKGGSYSQRFTLMRGNMSGGVVFGNNDGFVEVQISDPKFVSNKLIPEFLITQEDFSTLPEDQRGQRFPLIINQFRYIPCIRTSAYEYGTDFVVCQGHDVKINTVYVDGLERKVNDPDRGWSVVKKHTQRGIPYTAINFRLPSSSEEGMQSGEAVYVYAENVVQKEKNIIEQIREIVTIGTTFDSRFIDNYLFTSSASRCQSLSAEICINGSGENDIAFGTQYIEQTLLPSLPMISMVYTGFGYGPVFTDRRINIRPISLVRGRKYIFDRSTEIQESPVEQIYNKFTYRYSFNAMTNNYEKVVELDRQNNKLCEASEINFGIREYEPVDSICVYDDVTANYIINWLAAHYSFPSYYVEYEGVAGLFFLLSLGDNILLTDDKLEFVDVQCTVEKLQYQHSKCTIGLRMWLAYANKTPAVSSGTPLAPRTFSLYTGGSAFRNIQLSTTGIAPAAGTAFTMSMWIYMIDGVYEGNNRTFWSTNASSGSTTNTSIYLRVSFTLSRFEIKIRNSLNNDDNDLFYTGIDPNTLTDGWHLFTVAFDGTAWDSTNHIYFYIDGVLNSSTSAQIRNDATDQFPLYTPARLTLLSGLGTTNNASADCHECYIADCTFFNTQLTGSEVEELYNSGSHYDPTTHSQASKLTSWWKFDDVGTSVINTNDATIEDVQGSNDVSTTVTDISASLSWNSIYKGP